MEEFRHEILYTPSVMITNSVSLDSFRIEEVKAH
jgi:hypothetical protein